MSAAAGPQARATDPHASAWVSANAGSGKTFVLVRRVIRLLLNGTDPARILCLTFTKAAAAEMANRVFEELAAWTTLDEAALASVVAEVDGREPSAATLAAARRLFARALDTPGGLKIQTIHAFCERLLHQFPFEANVAGRFEVLDELDAQALRAEARRRLWAQAAHEPDGRLGQALATVLSYTSDFVHENSVIEFVEKRDRLRLWIAACGTLTEALAKLKTELGLAADENPGTLRHGILDQADFDADDLDKLVGYLREGSANDLKAAERLAPVITSDDREARTAAYLSFYLKSNGETRVANKIVTRKTSDRWPGLTDRLVAESARVEQVFDRLRLAECYESSAAMLHLADGAVTCYDDLKRFRGVLDFEDLVVKTVGLLSRSDASAWVHYKLDRGLDHILVDEAQDTSPRQWQVIESLADEFFAGEGAGSALRTIFAVGDEKQSIYSFQGAVPAWFARIRERMRSRAEAGDYLWQDVPLHVSRRSTPAVLEAVDSVFRPADVHRGLALEAEAPVHEAHRRNEPGRVVVWPVLEQPDRPIPDDWASPLDHLGEASPEVKLAERIADTVGGWIDGGEILEATGKPITARDVLILTRTRGALSDAINRRLMKRGITIAGTDRLALTGHIAVMDLLALGRFTLLPGDDLSLAAVLKSPLIGLDDNSLFRLAHGRDGSLWASLNRHAEADLECAMAVKTLERWMGAAKLLGPHGFFSLVTGPDGARRSFLRRLGPEADDVLDALLALALDDERTNIPSLQGFIARLDDAQMQIKRDFDKRRDEVRVMTVHGAKGLEAPIVFLVDNGSLPVHVSHDPRLLEMSGGDGDLVPPAIVWNRSAGVLPKLVKNSLEDWRERAREEYRRLLYVAMTRARDRLYVVGIDKRTSDKEFGWHALVRHGLEAGSTEVRDSDGALVALEWRRGGEAKPPVEAAKAEGPPHTARPAWLDRRAPPTIPVRQWVAPSSVLETVELFRAADPHAAEGAVPALVRGRVVHRMLQSLPDQPPPARRPAAQNYLDRVARDWPAEERERAIQEVMAILDDPAFAAVFAPGSRSEVDIAGTTGSGRVAGRIDRLAVTAQSVLIVDYKTNRIVPQDIGQIPAAYLAQLALYAHVLGRIYPGKSVETALLWTSGPVLTRLPEDVIERVKATVLRG
jgi:ATP-dependent helicase/nuclease subunit A